MRGARAGAEGTPVVVLFLLLIVTIGVGCSAVTEHDVNRGTTGRDADTVAAGRAVDEFFRRYVADDGRVIRQDQGGDTVSEGQAYAMTMSAAVGDEEGFRRVWRWTADHLQRDDGLFAWRWHHGRIVSDEPATDADLWIAGALSIAATRFDDPSLAHQAREIGDAILRLETTEVAGRPVLVAGPWARHDGVVNPSYLTTVLMTPLWRMGQHDWAAVAATSRQLLDDLTADAPHLAPDLAGALGWDPPHRRSPREANLGMGRSAHPGPDGRRLRSVGTRDRRSHVAVPARP